MKKRILVFLLALLLLFNIFKLNSQKLFTKLNAENTHIYFKNQLFESPDLNLITYEYFYNGGGVSTADFNNDGLIDIYFTANLLPNKLYLNKGNFVFEDITLQANVQGKKGWKTGVTIADVNGDGYMDIYVCYSGDLDSNLRENQLFINNGNLTFTESAKEYGLNHKGYSSQACFFDMDNDGDLDMYLLNHNVKDFRNFDVYYVKNMVDKYAGDKLFENKNNHFDDITQKAGIISNPLGYGLGLHIADINNDGWQDIYIGNDYVEEDYLYINNKNGTYTESLKKMIGHISNFSMGNDIADINNDGWLDIINVDMLPRDNKRQKLLFTPDNYEIYNNLIEHGFYHQIMRNMLQLNNGNNTFSEIGQLANISNTDWSWASILADFDCDGYKDLFISNGYGKDVTNLDFIQFYANERMKFLKGRTNEKMFDILQTVPQTALHNYYFKNNHNLQFIEKTLDIGFVDSGITNGVAFADLDNDGDLDLILNNLNNVASIYRNNTIEFKKNASNFLQFKISSDSKNTFAIGTKISLFLGSSIQVLDNLMVKGFQSSMQIPFIFYFNENKVDSILINWSNGEITSLYQPINLNQIITLKEPTRLTKNNQFTSYKFDKKIFNKIPYKPFYAININNNNEFKTQPTMLKMNSFYNPQFVIADLNNDSLTDMYITRNKNEDKAIYQQNKFGDFFPTNQSDFMFQKEYQDASALFVDIDNDGDKDLYIVSGGYYKMDSNLFNDRLFINDKNKFVEKKDAIPPKKYPNSKIIELDFNNDGFLDLLIGGSVSPENYPISTPTLLLLNNKNNTFSDVTNKYNSNFKKIGIINDVAWIDLDNDNKKELVVTGEWMNIKVFNFIKDTCIEVTSKYFKDSLFGWWNVLHFADIDNDGDLDLFAGNWGLNSQLNPNKLEPIRLYFFDFDSNKYIDPFFTLYLEHKEYPFMSRGELFEQISSIKQKFPNYESYSNAQLVDIFPTESIKKADTLFANYFNTCYFENINGKLIKKELPIQVNFSPIYSILTGDFNEDGFLDVLLTGNIDKIRIKLGKIDANYGVLLEGDGKGNFKYINQINSGLEIKGCVRDAIILENKKIIFGLINENPIFYQYK